MLDVSNAIKWWNKICKEMFYAVMTSVGAHRSLMCQKIHLFSQLVIYLCIIQSSVYRDPCHAS